MKKLSLSPILFGILIISAFFYSCSQDSSANKASPSFKWSLDGGPQEKCPAIAYLNDIEATGTKNIEIAVHTQDGFPVGTYTMDSTGGNIIGLTDGVSPNLGSISGLLNITSSSTTKVSGNFDVILSDGSNLKGSFSNIEFD